MEGILHWEKNQYVVKDLYHTTLATFSNVHDIAPCLHGDNVLVKGERVVLQERANYIPIVGVLELRNKTH